MRISFSTQLLPPATLMNMSNDSQRKHFCLMSTAQ